MARYICWTCSDDGHTYECEDVEKARMHKATFPDHILIKEADPFKEELAKDAYTDLEQARKDALRMGE